MGGLDQFRTLIEDRNHQDLNLMEREIDRLHDESDTYCTYRNLPRLIVVSRPFIYVVVDERSIPCDGKDNRWIDSKLGRNDMILGHISLLR